MIAIKNWFLQKNNLEYLRGKDNLEIEKETEKAAYIGYKSGNLYVGIGWFPKSVIIDDWEAVKAPKVNKNFEYHDYLVDTVNQAYRDGRLENKTFMSGRNRYDQTSFTHQSTTKELINFLQEENIEYMTREEWNNR